MTKKLGVFKTHFGLVVTLVVTIGIVAITLYVVSGTYIGTWTRRLEDAAFVYLFFAYMASLPFIIYLTRRKRT